MFPAVTETGATINIADQRYDGLVKVLVDTDGAEWTTADKQAENQGLVPYGGAVDVEAPEPEAFKEAAATQRAMDATPEAPAEAPEVEAA